MSMSHYDPDVDTYLLINFVDIQITTSILGIILGLYKYQRIIIIIIIITTIILYRHIKSERYNILDRKIIFYR